MIIDAVNPTSFHTDDQPIPSQQNTQPDDDDESVEQDLVDEIMATLQNDECAMHEIQIMHPPDIQHIYHHDVSKTKLMRLHSPLLRFGKLKIRNSTSKFISMAALIDQ